MAHGRRRLVEQPGERVTPQRVGPAGHRIHRSITRRPGGGAITRSVLRTGRGRQGPFVSNHWPLSRSAGAPIGTALREASTLLSTRAPDYTPEDGCYLPGRSSSPVAVLVDLDASRAPEKAMTTIANPDCR